MIVGGGGRGRGEADVEKMAPAELHGAKKCAAAAGAMRVLLWATPGTVAIFHPNGTPRRTVCSVARRK